MNPSPSPNPEDEAAVHVHCTVTLVLVLILILALEAQAGRSLLPKGALSGVTATAAIVVRSHLRVSCMWKTERNDRHYKTSAQASLDQLGKQAFLLA